MSERKPISNSVRFEIFKRDSFTCQYCGEKAPQVVLQIDHIRPVTKGGDNDPTNLITSCWTCNSGKGPRELHDREILEKQRAQLDELEERRQQLVMLLQWRDGLQHLGATEIDAFSLEFSKKASGFSVNESGRDKIQRWLSKYTMAELLAALDASCESYLRKDDEGKIAAAVAGKVFDAIPRIAAINKRGGLSAEMKQIYYIRGILRNRLSYLNEWMALALLKDAVGSGIDIDWLTSLAKQARSWSQFRETVQDLLDEIGSEDG